MSKSLERDLHVTIATTYNKYNGIHDSILKANLFLPLALFALVALLRVAVGYQPHSGQDNHHGQRAAYGGDYEAQRHWMELTLHLPIGKWYWYDTEYWGLDYPPLTAYVSYLCGLLSHFLVGPESVAFETSRGYEDPIHKAFMRATVLVTDLLCFGTAAWTILSSQRRMTAETLLTKTNRDAIRGGTDVESASMAFVSWNFIMAMIQPAILLIDHGHFQYNTIALGLSLWSFYYMTKTINTKGSKGSMRPCVIGSVFFCLALSFKQMTLYYAPAVFFYLLGRCFASTNKDESTLRFMGTVVQRVAALAVTVILCFVALWWPFVAYGPETTSLVDRAVHVLHRIVPLQRGLFEGKVSNLWCALSVKPFSIRQRIPLPFQPIAALILTVILTVPCSVKLFRFGKGWKLDGGTSISNRAISSERSLQQLLWGATSSALAFFLASFQVHEKSLLIALAPCALLWSEDATFVHWFTIVTVWTLWPLIQIDRLQTAYVCTILIYLATRELRRELTDDRTINKRGFFEQSALFRWIPSTTFAVMIALHTTEMVVSVPEHLPDLFAVLWSVVGCGFCCLAWFISTWHLFQIPEPSLSRPTKRKVA